MLEINEYTIKLSKLEPKSKLRIALASDLHNFPSAHIISLIEQGKPDIIAVPGDIANRYTDGFDNALKFLKESAKIVPTFFCSGNHELKCGGIPTSDIERTGAILLDNTFTFYKGFCLGGFPTFGDIDKLDIFSSQEGVKILLAHHPEYYPKYFRQRNIDIILSGHAHGGQVRIFGRGLYSPGQGILPRLTSGVHENRLVISRGLCNSQKVPRINNRPELVFVNLLPQDD